MHWDRTTVCDFPDTSAGNVSSLTWTLYIPLITGDEGREPKTGAHTAMVTRVYRYVYKAHAQSPCCNTTN